MAQIELATNAVIFGATTIAEINTESSELRKEKQAFILNFLFIFLIKFQYDCLKPTLNVPAREAYTHVFKLNFRHKRLTLVKSHRIITTAM